ncbi:hypothetical protein [Cohnella mopanensis]|uniref:hypothetical protein n=1 Tax=Cohnella mopanensis TaxID=2911966 RepID=UPI001EF82B2B|nr:hypothetical protein [Cohnella mopanensis]
MKIVKLFGFIYDDVMKSWDRWETDALMLAPDVFATVEPRHSEVELLLARPSDTSSNGYLALSHLCVITVASETINDVSEIPSEAMPFLLWSAERKRDLAHLYAIPEELNIAIPA